MFALHVSMIPNSSTIVNAKFGAFRLLLMQRLVVQRTLWTSRCHKQRVANTAKFEHHNVLEKGLPQPAGTFLPRVL